MTKDYTYTAQTPASQIDLVKREIVKAQNLAAGMELDLSDLET